jgi:hypothetical protein
MGNRGCKSLGGHRKAVLHRHSPRTEFSVRADSTSCSSPTEDPSTALRGQSSSCRARRSRVRCSWQNEHSNSVALFAPRIQLEVASISGNLFAGSRELDSIRHARSASDQAHRRGSPCLSSAIGCRWPTPTGRPLQRRIAAVARGGSNWRIWTPPRLQALRSLALRYDCSRISGLYLPHRAIDAGP